MLAISRFRVGDDHTGEFVARARQAVALFGETAGCLGAEVLQNLDEPGLWVIASRWADVGSYRRSFGGVQAKLVLVPLLSEAIDEPGAFAEPAEVGENRPRGAVT